MEGAAAKEIVEAIFTATDTFAEGAHQQDDMTVVVVRRI
jgi:serine phosphatase RsbU (regulator of sigma subunit)